MSQQDIIRYSVAIATMFATISSIPQYLSWWLSKKGIWYRIPAEAKFFSNPMKLPRRIKPFDCAECLSFWIAVAICIKSNYNAFNTLCTASIAITVTYVLNTAINAVKR